LAARLFRFQLNDPRFFSRKILKGLPYSLKTDAFQIPLGRTGAPMTQNCLNHAKLVSKLVQDRCWEVPDGMPDLNAVTVAVSDRMSNVLITTETITLIMTISAVNRNMESFPVNHP
jgi:hypothetical protein